jgi:hypothetical protein
VTALIDQVVSTGAAAYTPAEPNPVEDAVMESGRQLVVRCAAATDCWVSSW